MYLINDRLSHSDEEGIDDEERGVRRAQTARERSRKRRSENSIDRVSIVEKAIDKTSFIFKKIAFFMKDKIEKIKDYMW